MEKIVKHFPICITLTYELTHYLEFTVYILQNRYLMHSYDIQLHFLCNLSCGHKLIRFIIVFCYVLPHLINVLPTYPTMTR